MCSAAEVVVILLVLAIVAIGARAMTLHHRFSMLLEKTRPDTWEGLGTTGLLKYDESPRGTALAWFIFKSEYRYLDDAKITHEGNRVRNWTYTTYALILIALIAAHHSSYASATGCLFH